LFVLVLFIVSFLVGGRGALCGAAGVLCWGVWGGGGGGGKNMVGSAMESAFLHYNCQA